MNKQNDRVYLRESPDENLHLQLATRTGAPKMVTADDDRSLLVFIDRGVKINAEYNRENVLKTVLKP